MRTQQPRQQKRSGKQKFYTIASNTWTITSWIWTAIIIVFVLQFIPTYLFSEPSHTWEVVLNWFNDGTMAFPWNTLRILAIIAIPLLASITFAAWVLKRSLQEGSEGLNKLIEVLEQDIITPQLEVLQGQFQQLLQTQVASFNVLSQSGEQLQRIPTTAELKDLQTLTHQQHLSSNEKFNQLLQDIHIRTIEQVEWLDNLLQQSRHTEETISTELHAIASILEQLQNKVEFAHLSDPLLRGAKSDQFATTEPFAVVSTTPLPLEQLKPSSIELVEPSTPESSEEPAPKLAAHHEQPLSA